MRKSSPISSNDQSAITESDLPESELDLDPVFAPWDGRRVPVTLVGGYLGVGKTTLINEVLARSDQPIAVMVNDVGQVNIDARLIARHDGDTIELTDGCVCCSLATGLVEAFAKLRLRPSPPEHVIMELSGVARPGRVAPWANTPGFRLDGTVVLVDVDQFLERLSDDRLTDVIRSQVAAADVLALTKVDLVDQRRIENVRHELREIAGATPVLEAGHAMHVAALVGHGSRRPGGVADLPDGGLFDPHEVDLVRLENPITPEALAQIVDELPDDVLRAKAVANHGNGSYSLVQVVGRRRSISPLSEAEHQDATELVVIRPR